MLKTGSSDRDSGPLPAASLAISYTIGTGGLAGPMLLL